VGLALVLALAAGLRLWRLDQNGFDNEYYAAAVRRMMGSGTPASGRPDGGSSTI
jgi:4-amino-4-deoxy-L-arabinose transferase-like glycosyltransferase